MRSSVAISLLLAFFAPYADAVPHPPIGDSRPQRPNPFPIHGITEPLDRERPRPAVPIAKSALLFDDCTSAAIAVLTAGDLITYLSDHPVGGCLDDFLWTFDDNLAATFTDANMQTVFQALEGSAPDYDGTNADGLHQLWFFARVGYFHEFFEAAVADFDAQTLALHVAASDAFAASPHLYADNDEAARILADWFAVTDQQGVRQNHLAQVVQTLTSLTATRAQSESQLLAYNSVFFLLFRGIANGDEVFIQAVGQEPDIVDALTQAALYEFLYPDGLYLLENAVRELGRLTAIDPLQDSAVAALISVLATYQRLSGPFLLAADSVGEYVDCAQLDICRADLEAEVIEEVFPHTYPFDDGALIFETSLDLTTVQPLYHAAKQVEAQFFRLIEIDRAVAEDVNDVLYVKLYGTNAEYVQFQGYLFGLDSNNGGIYIEPDATFYTYQRTRDQSVFTLEELFRHEYVHYLAGRYLHPGLWGQTDIYQDCRLTWFDEGLAEFLAGSTQAAGVAVRPALVQAIAADGDNRLDPSELVYSCYADGFRFYNYAGLFFNLLHQQRRGRLLDLFDLVRSGDNDAYDAVIEGFEGDAELADDYSAFLDRQVADAESLANSTTRFPRLTGLASADPAEIETALGAIDDTLDPACRSVAAQLNHRFGCEGTLRAVGTLDADDRGAVSEHFYSRLDDLITATVDGSGINNFAAMNCYFSDVTGPGVLTADFTCSGPLRRAGTGLDSDGDGIADEADDFPLQLLAWSDADGDGVVDADEVPDGDLDGMPDGWERLFGLDEDSAADAGSDADGDGVANRVEFEWDTDPRDGDSAPPTVDLITDLRNDSQALAANADRALNLYVGLRFFGATASSVALTYSASLPLRLEEVLKSGASNACELVESSPLGGTVACGDLSEGGTGLDLFLLFTPLENGPLEFTVGFSADELELDPADNVRFLDELHVAHDAAAIAAADFDGDGVVGFSDFSMFADAFGRRPPLRPGPQRHR